MSAEIIKKRRPRKRRWRRFKEGEVHRGIYIVPNLFTTANLFSGFFGIVNAINGDYLMAAYAILASCVFDILDGKVARFTRATSRFGVEYDSLADLVSFGVAPGLLMYLWTLRPYGRIGWLAAFVFMACGALRLARFNVQTGTISSKYFVGLPIPGGAGMIATTVIFLSKWHPAPFSSAANITLLVTTYLLGFLMVSTFPFNSFKDLESMKSKPLPTLFLVIVGVTVVAMSHGPVLFLCGVTYVISGPVGYLVLKHKGSPYFQKIDPAAGSEAAKEEQTAEIRVSDLPEEKPQS